MRGTHPKQTEQYLQENYQLDLVFGNETINKTSAEKRANIFIDYLLDDEVKMLWALRGGEGTADILPYIEARKDEIAQLPQKILMGYSDFTPILIYFAQTFGWQTVHGPAALLLSQLRIKASTERATMNLLFGKDKPLIFDQLHPLNEAAHNHSEIDCSVTGGTLSLVHTSLKDIWEINTRDKIIMLEDVAEKTHKISRMLKHLHRIGKFDYIKGMILGDFIAKPIGSTKEEKLANIDSINRLFPWFAKQLEIPVYQTEHFGHGKENIPFIYNRKAILKKNQLIFD